MPDLRLLTYNVRSLRDDRDAVAAVVRACRPDVVAVQEAPRAVRWRSKRAALARLCGLVVATADRPGGLMIMTTLAVSVERSSFALLPKSPDLHQRAVCLADLRFAGRTWSVASVHFSLDADERLAHLDALWPVLDQARGPLVVAGDVNERPDGPVWQRLSERLVDAYAAAGTPNVPTFSTRHPHRRIDGVWVDPTIEVVECRVVDDVPGLVEASDHRPVLAVLRQPEA